MGEKFDDFMDTYTFNGNSVWPRPIAQAAWDEAIKTQWNDVNEELPEVGKCVLWKTDKGYVTYYAIEEEMTPKLIKQLIDGDDIRGRLVKWMHVPE